MSWMAKLYDTYEHALKLDLPRDRCVMPIGHTLQNAHINIVIDGEGNFRRASILPKSNAIILPTTENAQTRSGKKPPPYALADKLRYVAKDYLDYGGQKDCFFGDYHKQLKEWVESNFSHPHIFSIYQYVVKGGVIRDLVNEKIITLNNQGKLSCPHMEDYSNKKDNKPELIKSLGSPDQKTKRWDQGDALICWSVEAGVDPDSDTWKNSAIQKCWTAYNASLEGITGMCCVTGKEQPLATKHPKLKGNDFDGFTFLGRFTDQNKKAVASNGYQAIGIGYETSQKAHNALQWLISRRQSFRNGDQIIVAWAISGKTTPEPMRDSLSFINEPLIQTNDGDEQEEPVPDHTRDIGQSFATALNKAISGYKAKLEPTEDIVIMGLDSVTDGRMALIYYRETFAYDENKKNGFIDFVGQWHEDMAWFQHYLEAISAPAPERIVEVLYEQGISPKLRQTLKKNLMARLLPCIVEGRTIPWDIVNTCTDKVNNRQAKRLDKKFSNAKSERKKWYEHLSIACALYKGYYKRHPKPQEKREYLMALDEKRTSRDYLYGRLLAIAEHIESMALSIANENRATNAERLMQRFSQHPYETWPIIKEQLAPYLERIRSRYPPLNPAFKGLLHTITDLFEPEAFIKKAPLEGEYLLGYHCQHIWLQEHAYEKGSWIFKNKSDRQSSGENQ